MRRTRPALLLTLALFGAAPPGQTSSELIRLEQVLDRAQESKSTGKLPAERYDQFLIQFRVSLDKAWALSLKTPPETGAYARIQARLGSKENAVALIATALKQDPTDADLLLTSGELAAERKNFPSALAQANTILKREPGNARALALKRYSEGRVARSSDGKGPPLFPAEIDGVSPLEAPEVVAAGKQALARKNALKYLDLSVAALKMKDPSESLRFLSLAEACDPALVDIPMQQGIAYMDLKDPAKANPRFAQAEAMWAAEGNSQAALARKLKERSASSMISPRNIGDATQARPEPELIGASNPMGGLFHYLGRSEKPRRVQFSEVDTAGLRIASFPQMAEELSKPARDARVKIVSKRGWTTKGMQWPLLGRIQLVLRGNLTIHENCRWSFNGSLRAMDDFYNFEESDRGFVGETLTTIGRNIPGKHYPLEIRGFQAVNELGVKEACP